MIDFGSTLRRWPRRRMDRATLGVLCSMAGMLFEAGRTIEAREAADGLSEPDDPHVLALLRATMANEAGDRNSAEAHLCEALAVRPDDEVVLDRMRATEQMRAFGLAPPRAGTTGEAPLRMVVVPNSKRHHDSTGAAPACALRPRPFSGRAYLARRRCRASGPPDAFPVPEPCSPAAPLRRGGVLDPGRSVGPGLGLLQGPVLLAGEARLGLHTRAVDRTRQAPRCAPGGIRAPERQPPAPRRTLAAGGRSAVRRHWNPRQDARLQRKRGVFAPAQIPAHSSKFEGLGLPLVEAVHVGLTLDPRFLRHLHFRGGQQRGAPVDPDDK